MATATACHSLACGSASSAVCPEWLGLPALADTVQKHPHSRGLAPPRGVPWAGGCSAFYPRYPLKYGLDAVIR